MKKLTLLFIFIFTSNHALAQHKKINCDSVYNSYAKFHKGKIGIIYFTKAPEIKNPPKSFIFNLNRNNSKNDTLISTFIKFIIDKHGTPTCFDAIGNNTSNKLAKMALKEVKKLNFSPAKQNSDTLIVPMVLNLKFKINADSARIYFKNRNKRFKNIIRLD